MLSLIKVSVIIPVYNTQDFLKECIDSVVNQTLADIEIICINDGSSDSSLDMLEEYRKKDSRIRLISQSHIGVGVARNAALDIVRGEYILFLDSDDYLDLNSLEYLYNTSKDKNLDMLMFKITNFNNKTGKESISPYFEMDFLEEIVGDEIFSWKDIKDCIFDVSVSITSKLFRKEMISDIRFPEGLIFEDNLFSIKTLLNAQRIYFSDRHLYHRRIHSNSITNSYHERFTDCMDIYDLIVDYIKEIGEYDEFHVQIFDRQCFDFFHRFRQLEDEYKNGFFIKLNDYFSNHKDTLEGYGTLDSCSERSLVIYNSAIGSDNYDEFELSVNFFDLKLKNKEYKKEISRLKKSNKKYMEELKTLKSSKSWKVAKIFRK